jgi:hypothetical protein
MHARSIGWRRIRVRRANTTRQSNSQRQRQVPGSKSGATDVFDIFTCSSSTSSGDPQRSGSSLTRRIRNNPPQSIGDAVTQISTTAGSDPGNKDKEIADGAAGSIGGKDGAMVGATAAQTGADAAKNVITSAPAGLVRVWQFSNQRYYRSRVSAVRNANECFGL